MRSPVLRAHRSLPVPSSSAYRLPSREGAKTVFESATAPPQYQLAASVKRHSSAGRCAESVEGGVEGANVNAPAGHDGRGHDAAACLELPDHLSAGDRKRVDLMVEGAEVGHAVGRCGRRPHLAAGLESVQLPDGGPVLALERDLEGVDRVVRGAHHDYLARHAAGGVGAVVVNHGRAPDDVPRVFLQRGLHFLAVQQNGVAPAERVRASANVEHVQEAVVSSNVHCAAAEDRRAVYRSGALFAEQVEVPQALSRLAVERDQSALSGAGVDHAFDRDGPRPPVGVSQIPAARGQPQQDKRQNDQSTVASHGSRHPQFRGQGHIRWSPMGGNGRAASAPARCP